MIRKFSSPILIKNSQIFKIFFFFNKRNKISHFNDPQRPTNITDTHSKSVITVVESLTPKKDVKKEMDNNERSKRKTLIMVLWVSIVFSSSRFVFGIANLSFLLLPYSMFNWWAQAFNLFYSSCVYTSYFFVYMKTNKHFRKKFYEIFLRKNITS